MAKHQERVIVDVRHIFPPAPGKSPAVSTDGNKDIVQTPHSTSLSCKQDAPTQAEANNNSNFILGGGKEFDNVDLVLCNRHSGRNQGFSEAGDRFPGSEDNSITSQQISHKDNAYSNHGSLLELHSFDVNAFMTSYTSGGLNRTNPLFHEKSVESADTQSQLTEDNRRTSLESNDSILSNGNCTHMDEVISSPSIERVNNTASAKNMYNEMMQNSDLMMEEEITMDFLEEEAEDRLPKLYTEYQGEDYSKYLNDDVTMNNYTTSKRKDRKSKLTHGTNILELSTSNLASGDSLNVSDSKMTPNDKTKFTGVFHFNSINGRTKPVANGQNSIHDFTYAKSKIGVNRNIGDHPVSDSDHCIQINDPDNFPHSPWYSIERQAKGNSDVTLRSRQPSMSSNGSSNSGSQKSPQVLDDSLDDFISKYDNQNHTDFESTRKSILYDTSEKQPKKHNRFFNKIKRNKKNIDKSGADTNYFVKNTVFNPLSDSSDVYL